MDGRGSSSKGKLTNGHKPRSLTRSPARSPVRSPARSPARSPIRTTVSSSAFNSVTNNSNTNGHLGSDSKKPTRGRRVKGNSQVFNPKLIVSQMVALQSIHYFILCFFVQANHFVFGTSITIDRIFTAQYLNIWTHEGWIDNSAILLSSLTGAILLSLIVEKAKKCLDFSVTLFTIHVIACTIYGGLPLTWDWWIVNVLHMIFMILLGEYFCAMRELREIPLLSLDTYHGFQ